MIRVLILAESRAVRDAWEVALRQFPGFTGVALPPTRGSERVREEDFHLVILEAGSDAERVRRLALSLREAGAPPTVVVAEADTLKLLVAEKRHLGVTAFLARPLEAIPVFRLLGQLRERLANLDLSAA